MTLMNRIFLLSLFSMLSILLFATQCSSFIFYVSLFMLLSIAVQTYFLYTYITNKNQKIIQKLHYLHINKYQDEDEDRNEKDELSLILKSLSQLSSSLKNISFVAQNISNGNLSTKVPIKGNDDLLALSINKIVDTLQNKENLDANEKWLNDGVLEFNEILLKSMDLQTTTDVTINFLCRHINAFTGLIYYYNHKHEQLELSSSYAYFPTATPLTYKLGESSIGEVAKSKNFIEQVNIQNFHTKDTDNITNNSRINTFTFALSYQGELYGVIELSTYQVLSDIQKEFLLQMESTIATAMSSAANKQAVDTLLIESQVLNNTMKEREKAQDAHSIVGITNIDGTITYANEKFSQLSGYTNEELIGANHRIVNSGEYPDSFWKKMYDTVLAGKVWHHPAIKNKAKDGSTYYVDTTISPLIGKDGKPEAFIAIRTDVTQRAQETLELAQAKEEAQILNRSLKEREKAQDAHSIVGITNIDGTITYANEKFSQLSGYTNEELIGANHRIVNSGEYPDSFWKKMYDTVLAGKVWHHPAIKNKAKDGSTYYVDTTISPLIGKDGKPEAFIAIRTDVTQRAQETLELAQAKEAAESATKTKADFLASMSHEIRTPMNGVIGMLGLLQNSQLDNRQREHTNLAESSAVSLLSVINDILDFSKLEAGKIELENIECDIKQELSNFSKAISINIKNKDVELLLDINDIQHNNIITDIGRLKQILNNLVGNAIKFTQKGNIIIKASLNTQNQKQPRLYVSISDSGIGIAEDKLSSLFDPFTQADTSTTRKYGGTGLGLSIAKNLVEVMGGEIEVSSTLKKGTEFTFSIDTQLGQNTIKIMPSIDISGKRVLIVDDNEINLQILHAQLSEWKIDTSSANCASDAIQLCENAIKQQHIPPFDILITDMGMPEMDGASLGKELKKLKECQDMKMVLHTSFEQQDDINTLSEIGFNAFFTKPTSPKDLFNALNILADKNTQVKQKYPVLTKNNINTLAKNEKQWKSDTKILLVEDNITNQIVARAIMEEFNLECDIANNGQEALDILNNSKDVYTLVLMDCQMPLLDGFETTQAIRQKQAGDRYSDINILAMTANAMDGDKEKCLVSGMNDYISKPIQAEKLKMTLLKYIGA